MIDFPATSGRPVDPPIETESTAAAAEPLSPTVVEPAAGGASAESLPPTIEAEPAVAAGLFGADGARKYVRLLATDATIRGLIGPREAGRLWTRHVLNSAVVASLLPSQCTLVDIGSGAGLPGIPLAIARPDCRVVLVEPLERRSIFLAETIVALGLSNCRVVRGRADEVIDEAGNADIVTSRAVAPLAKLAGWSVPLLRLGGKMLALKGSSAQDEIERDADALARWGLVDVGVVTVGGGVVEPPTVVVTGTLARPAGRPAQRPTGRSRRGNRRGS